MIELMIVVAILGILAAVAIPKFKDMIYKSREGAAKANLASIKSALKVYYSDNEGFYPTGPAGDNTTFLQNLMTNDGKYISSWPYVHIPGHHQKTNTVDTVNNNDPFAADPNCDGEWAYVGNSADANWGRIMIECYHADSKGVIWSTY